MAGSFLELYNLGDLTAVIETYERDESALEFDSVADRIAIAQSYYKLGQPIKAASMFMKAALIGAVPNKPLLELALQLFRKAGDHDQGIEAAQHLIEIDPHHLEAATYYRHYLPRLALLKEIERSNRTAYAALSRGEAFAKACERPWDNIGWCADERINASITDPKTIAFTAESRAARRQLPVPSGKIRIGYLSNDFSTLHATMILFRAVLEAHDRNRFDIFFFCYTPINLKRMDRGFRENIGNIVDIGDLDDAAAAELIRSYKLDILVDLKGHTMKSRANLVNAGLAPVQAAFLGFPGSGTGIDCDYIIGDKIVTPDSSQPNYHEKFCRLPETYQPNDNVHRPLPLGMRKSDAGLPEGKIVFASFNAIRKVTWPMLGVWMDILKKVPNSILWVLCPDDVRRENFLDHVVDSGIDTDRIVFASGTGQDTHIARLQAASIGLDTYPCCGHTTTSDKLWAGLPVVTLRGQHFASRVSESLLQAVGMPELVADTPEDYVALAVRLAQAPAELEAVRQKLRNNRFLHPLFDTERFARHLEDAFTLMAERHRRGEAPDHIDVPARPIRSEPFRRS